MTESHTSPPERLGPYRLEGRIGRGGMGEVFLAHDDRLDRRVAVKRIRLDVTEHSAPGARERFRREARAAARLNHPSIVQIYDVLEAEGTDWIVFEYVAGRSLAEVAASGELAPCEALLLACQIAEGLAHAHARGFVHRDLKAENVRVTAEGRAKVLDLGLAKPLAAAGTDGGPDEAGSLTREGAVVGTPRAMAPEQVAGGPVDSRSDLFALGVLLYELLSGRSPFAASSASATLRNVLAADPVPLHRRVPDLPRAVSDLVAELLAPEPADRPASAAEVARRLRELASDPELPRRLPEPSGEVAPGLTDAVTGPGAPPPRGPDLLRRRRSRPSYRVLDVARRRWWVAGALLLAVLAALAWPRVRPSQVGDAPQSRVVAVSTSVPASGGDEAGLAAAGVSDAVVAALVSLEGIEVVDPGELAGLSGSAAERALSAGADEVASVSLTCDDEWCRAALRRLGPSGRVLSTAPPFEVSARPEDLLELASAVRLHVLELYPERAPRGEGAEPEVRAEDYEGYLRIRRRETSGDRLGAADLDRLEALLDTSPGFLEGHLLAASLARTLGQEERARSHADRAARLAPRDPRPLAVLARLALETGSLDEAERAVERLERAAPAELAADVARARLLERQDRRVEAVEAWRGVVDRRPSWTHLYWLARLERDAGRAEDARAHAEELLRRSPGNEYGLSLRATLDARAGRLEQAAETYRDLAARDPRYHYLANLGWVLFLQGRYEEAVDDFGRAQDLAPGDAHARFNLAVTHSAAGRLEQAQAIYRQILAEAESTGEGGAAVDPNALLIRAQCLARLGRSREAVALTDQTLTRYPDEAQLRYQAAQVYALVGERYSALHNVRLAREGGLAAVWFSVPAFERLRADPEFRELVEEAGGA